MVSVFSMFWYTTTQISMQCFTDYTYILLIALESIFNNQGCTLLYGNFTQPLKANYTGSKLLPQCQIQDLLIPYCERLWHYPKMNVLSFVIQAAWLFKSYLMFSRFLWIWAWSVPLLGINLNMPLPGSSICTAELMRLAALASYGYFVIIFFAMQ